MKTPPPWHAAARPLLGTMPDHQVARQVGASLSSVHTLRTGLGIPSYASTRSDPRLRDSWRSQALPLLGTMSDAEIAARVGVCAKSVFLFRRKQGVPTQTAAWSAAAEPLLGKMSDGKIARQFGVSAATVLKLRQARGIPPYSTKK
jgi:hypothetical protein